MVALATRLLEEGHATVRRNSQFLGGIRSVLRVRLDRTRLAHPARQSGRERTIGVVAMNAPSSFASSPHDPCATCGCCADRPLCYWGPRRAPGRPRETTISETRGVAGRKEREGQYHGLRASSAASRVMQTRSRRTLSGTAFARRARSPCCWEPARRISTRRRRLPGARLAGLQGGGLQQRRVRKKGAGSRVSFTAGPE